MCHTQWRTLHFVRFFEIGFWVNTYMALFNLIRSETSALKISRWNKVIGV